MDGIYGITWESRLQYREGIRVRGYIIGYIPFVSERLEFDGLDGLVEFFELLLEPGAAGVGDEDLGVFVGTNT